MSLVLLCLEDFRVSGLSEAINVKVGTFAPKYLDLAADDAFANIPGSQADGTRLGMSRIVVGVEHGRRVVRVDDRRLIDGISKFTKKHTPSNTRPGQLAESVELSAHGGADGEGGLGATPVEDGRLTVSK